MRLYLINPNNPLVSLANVKDSRWNRYRVWKPLGLLVLAGLTPPEWEITIIDENLGVPDYAAMPRPDLVGITAFTSQASRAYEVAAEFRAPRRAAWSWAASTPPCAARRPCEHVDSVVTGRGRERLGGRPGRRPARPVAEHLRRRARGPGRASRRPGTTC